MADTDARILSVTVVLRGTERYHMEAYLLKRGYRQEQRSEFSIPGLRVVLGEPKKVPLGVIRLTEVTVSFTGDRETAESESARFRLQFLTAGG